MAIFKKKEDELGVQPAQTVADASADAAAQAQADAAKQAEEAARRAEEEARAKAEAANRKAQEQGLNRTIAEHSKGVGYKVVEYGEYVGKPGQNPAVAEQINKSNKAGEIKHGQSTFGVTNQIVVDYSTIKDVKQAAYFGLAVPETDREKYIKQYAKATNQDAKTVLAQFESITGDRYFAAPKSDGGKIRAANKALSGYGLLDYNGNALDIYKSTPQQTIQSLHMEPDDDKRKDAFEAIKILQKTPGSAWYGMDLTLSDLDFMDSADLTASQYKKDVDKFNSSFSVSDKPTDANVQRYKTHVAYINARYGNNPRVQKYMMDALNKSFSDRNGGYMPEAGAIAQSVASAEQSGAIQIETDPVSGEVTGASWVDGIIDAVTSPTTVPAFEEYQGGRSGAKETVDKINEEDDKAGNGGKEVMGGLATVGEDGKVVLHGTFGDEEIGTTSKRSAGGGGSPALTGGTVTVNGQEVQMSVPLASAGTMHGLTRNQLFSGAIQLPGMEGFGNPLGVDLNKSDKPEVQGPAWIPPVYRNAADVIANADRQTTEVNEVVPYDPDMTDARAMALYYSGRELDARNKAQISAVADDRQSMDMLDAIYNANATTNGVASQRYPKYGNFIGWAMDSLSMGELDAESVNNGFFILNDVRKQINSMIENEGSIIVPYGVNQYDYILSRQPALMEKVEFVRGLPDEFRAAKTQAKADEAKELQAITDEYKAAMQRGDGTPDMAAWLALEDMGGTDPGMDWMDDPTYNELLRETTRGGSLFASKGVLGLGAGSGEFWNGESLAAKAARSLNDKDASLELKTYVNADTQDLLALMCQDAYQNNTTLDKWLESAGITGMDQLAEIAFKNGVRTGNMLKNNPQVTEALDTIDLSFGNSVSLGWNVAMTQSEAGTAETTQLILDKALHEGNRIEFRDKMWDAYGNQAPTVTRRKLYALLNGTDLSEESKEELKARLERSGDIFSVAADYIDLDGLQAWLHTKTNDKQKEAEDLMLIGSFLGGWDKRFFMAANMFGGTAAFAAKSTIGTVITGNPLAGAMIAGYGGIGDNYERYIDKGATEGEAWFMALSHWLVESKLNSGGNQSALDDMLAGENYIDDLFHALKNGKRNGFTTVMTAAKYMGGHALKRYAQEGGEGASEVLADTALEMLFDVYDQENEALKNGEGMSVSRLFETMLGTIEAVDPYEFGKEMLENFNAEGVMGFFMGMGGSLRLTGAAFADYRALKQYKSVQMMQQLYEGDIPGTEENIGLICQQMALDLRDPNYRKWLDGQSKARRDLKNFGVAAAEGVGIEERGAAAELAAQAKELGEKRDAAQTAMEEAEAYCTELEDQVSAGNIALKPDMDAARTAQTRAAQAYNELMDAARKKGAQAEEAAKKWMDIMLAATENIGAEDLNHAIGRWTAQTFDMARALYEKNQAAANAADHEAWLEETFDMAHEMQEEEQAYANAAEHEEWVGETFDMAHAQQEEEAELEAQVDAENEAKAKEEAIAAEEEAVAQMTDEEIDAEIAAITENESRMTEADAQSGEMGYDEETLSALKEQTDTEAEAKAARKEAILRNQRNQYKSLTDRAEQAVQLGDEEAQTELLKQRQAVQARIEALGGKIEDPAANAPEPTTDAKPAMPKAEAKAKAAKQTGGENAPEPSTQSAPAKPVQKADPRKEANHARIMERAADIATGTTKAERDAKAAAEAAQTEEKTMEDSLEQKYKEAEEAFASGDEARGMELTEEAGIIGIELDERTDRVVAEALDIEKGVTEKLEAQDAQKIKESAPVLEAMTERKALEEERRTLKDVFSSLTNTPIFVNASQLADMLYETGAKTLTELNKMLGMKLTRDPNKGVKLDGGWYQELKNLAPGYFRDDWDEHPEEALVALGQRKKSIMGEIASAKEAESKALEAYEAAQAAKTVGAVEAARDVSPGYELSQFENKTFSKSDVSTPESAKALEGTTHKVQTMDSLEEKAKKEVAQNGLRQTFARLMALERFSAQDVATAKRCLELFKANGDNISQAKLAAKMGKEGTRTGTELRTYGLFTTAAKAVSDLIEMADAYNKKRGRRKSVNVSEEADAQASIGETKHQPFMEEAVSRATSDPIGQKLASDVKTRSGLTVYWANLPDGMRGFYDRESGVIVLNQKIGAVKGAYITAIHEFTHHMENDPGYDAYADAVLKAAYGEGYKNSDARKADEAVIRDEYAERGQKLNDKLLRQELVAAATEQILLGDEAFMRTLFESGNSSLSVRILAGIDNFLRKDKAKKEGKEALERYNLLKNARSKMRSAVKNAPKWKAGQGGEAKAAVQVEHHQDSKGNRQQSIMDRDTYDKLGQPLPEGEVAMKAQPEGEQMRIEEKANVGETIRKVLANISALNEQEDISYDNPWKVGLNPFQRKQIAKYGLENVKLPGINYSRATIEQRMLCAIMATPKNDRGKGLMTLTEQLKELNKARKNPISGGRLAIVTNADLAYVLAQGAIVEASETDDEGIPFLREGKQAYARMLDAQANIQPVSLGEKAEAWRFISMLSAPATTIKNVTGNEIAKDADRVATASVVWLDKMIAKKTGTRMIGNTTRAERKAGTEAAKQRGRDAYDDYFVAKANTSRSRNYEIGGDGRVFESEALEFARNLIGFAMDAPDQMYMEKAIVEEMSVLERLGAKIMDEDTGDMRTMTENERYQEAYKRASNRFYHDVSFMTRLLSPLYGHPLLGKAARILVPFLKMSTNGAIRVFEYSPLGLAKSAVYDGLIAMNANKDERGVGANFDQYKFLMGMGRGMTGTGIATLGLLLYQAGIIEFGREDEEDEKRRDVKAALGEPYSMYINIGNTKHELSFAQPIASALAVGAGMARRMEDGEDLLGLAAGITSDIGNTFFESSYLSTLNDIFSGYGSIWDKLEAAPGKIAASYTQQMFSPALFRALAKATDRYARDTYSSNKMIEMLNKNVIQYWPGLRQTLPIRVDMTGDKMTQHRTYQEMESWAGNVLNFVDSFLSPTATYSDKDDPQLIELLDLSYRTGKTDFLPPDAFAQKNTVKVNKSLAKDMKMGNAAFAVDLTDEQQRMVNQMYSTILFNGTGGMRYMKPGTISTYKVEGLRSLMAGKKWKTMSDEERMKEVDAMKKTVNELVTVYVAENFR